MRRMLVAALLLHAAAVAQPPAASDEAARLARIETLEAEGPESFPAWLNAVVEMGTFYGNQGRYRDALPLLRRAHRGSEQHLGAQHPMTEQLRATVLLMERFVSDRGGQGNDPAPAQ